jgi:hypothetical protein
MTPRIYQTKLGYDIVTSDGRLFRVQGTIKLIGRVGDKFQPSGKLLKNVPNHLKTIFYELQKQ